MREGRKMEGAHERERKRERSACRFIISYNVSMRSKGNSDQEGNSNDSQVQSSNRTLTERGD